MREYVEDEKKGRKVLKVDLDGLYETCGHLYEMYGHIIDSLYSFAAEHRLGVSGISAYDVVDEAILQEYIGQKKQYQNLRLNDIDTDENVRSLDVHVLDYRVRSHLEELAGKGA